VIRWGGESGRGVGEPGADLIVENLCLRPQLIVLQRRTPRPRLRDGDRIEESGIQSGVDASPLHQRAGPLGLRAPAGALDGRTPSESPRR
jgi:hypothetical protein